MPQLTYTAFKPVVSNNSQVRGNDVYFPFQHDMAAAVVEARFFLEDVDGVAVYAATLEENAAQWTINEEVNEGIFLLGKNDTADLVAPYVYWYAIDLVDAAGRRLTAIYGRHELIDDIVNDSLNTNAPLSYAARGTLEADIDALASAVSASRVTATAASGAATIQTADTNDDIFAAADDIYILLDNGSWQLSENITSAADGLITLNSDTLDDDVTKNVGFVRKVL